MKLSKKEVLNLAHLAKLKLKNKEITLYQKQLRNILNYIHKINELDLEEIKESISGAENIVTQLREDIVHASQPALRKQAQQNKDNYIVVPKVLDK